MIGRIAAGDAGSDAHPGASGVLGLPHPALLSPFGVNEALVAGALEEDAAEAIAAVVEDTGLVQVIGPVARERV